MACAVLYLQVMTNEIQPIQLETVCGGVQQLVNRGSGEAPIWQWEEIGGPVSKPHPKSHGQVKAPVPHHMPAFGKRRGFMGLLQGLRSFL